MDKKNIILAQQAKLAMSLKNRTLTTLSPDYRVTPPPSPELSSPTM